jgi:hypothetical protein
MSRLGARPDLAAASSRLREARALFEQVALSEHLVDFLTLPAYDRMLASEA